MAYSDSYLDCTQLTLLLKKKINIVIFKGVACSEVEIDCLTGSLHFLTLINNEAIFSNPFLSFSGDSFVRRVDILMDIGNTLSHSL